MMKVLENTGVRLFVMEALAVKWVMNFKLQRFRSLASIACALAFLALVLAPFVHQIQVSKNSPFKSTGPANSFCQKVARAFSTAQQTDKSTKNQGSKKHDPATCKVCQSFLSSKHFAGITPVLQSCGWRLSNEFHFIPTTSHVPGIAELTGTNPQAPPSFC